MSLFCPGDPNRDDASGVSLRKDVSPPPPASVAPQEWTRVLTSIQPIGVSIVEELWRIDFIVEQHNLALREKEKELDRLMERSVFAMSILEDDETLWREAYEKSDKCPMLDAAFALRQKLEDARIERDAEMAANRRYRTRITELSDQLTEKEKEIERLRGDIERCY